MSLIPITVYGDSILRKTIDSIPAVNDELIENIQDMFETMRNANGIGLSANQVGLNKKMFIVDLKGVEGYDDFKPLVVINPEIIEHSDDLVIMEEGCLSLPNVYGKVVRPSKVKVKWQNLAGNWCEKKLEDWDARIFLHEFDHLEGIMFTDYLK